MPDNIGSHADPVWILDRIGKLRQLRPFVFDKRALRVIDEMIDEGEARLRELTKRSNAKPKR